MAKENLKKRPKRGTEKILTLLLLVLPIGAISQLELVHLLVHNHDITVTHSHEQEKDPCHRLIYHSDAEQGCHHHSHLNVSDKCEMCDLAYQGVESALPAVEFASGEFATQHVDFYKFSLDSYWIVISSSRAPPALG